MRTTETCEVVSIATSDISARVSTNPVPGYSLVAGAFHPLALVTVTVTDSSPTSPTTLLCPPRAPCSIASATASCVDKTIASRTSPSMAPDSSHAIIALRRCASRDGSCAKSVSNCSAAMGTDRPVPEFENVSSLALPSGQRLLACADDLKDTKDSRDLERLFHDGRSPELQSKGDATRTRSTVRLHHFKDERGIDELDMRQICDHDVVCSKQ